MVKYAFLIFILCFTACKSVEKMGGTAVSAMLSPISNTDLLQLKLGLHQYKLANTNWPFDSSELNNFLINKDMEPLQTNKYEILEWFPISDTVKVTYLLRYNEPDSMEFNSLQGSFNLYLDNDSTLNSVHRKMTVEKKDNTFIEMQGEYLMQIEKP